MYLMYPISRATARIHFISLLLAYALIVSLLAPFAIKRAQAFAETDSGGNALTIEGANRELSLSSSAQGAGQRPGELLRRAWQTAESHDAGARQDGL